MKSKSKLPHIDKKIFKKSLLFFNANRGKGEVWTTGLINRNSVISEEFSGWTLDIFNGVTYKRTAIKDNHIGLKLGEFSFTRRRAKHEGKRKKKHQYNK